MLRQVGFLERNTLALGMAVAAIGAVIVAFAWASTNGLPFQGRYPFTVVVPGSTPPLASGDQVRVAGKIAGSVTGVVPGPDTLRVNAYLYSSYGRLGAGASVHVGVVLGTSLVYLVVSPGNYRRPLPAGSVIPESRVTLSSSLPQALETFDAATRRALARNLTVTGEGWVGNGAATNTAIADQKTDYEDGTPLLRALLTPVPGTLARAIQGAADFAAELRGRRPDDDAALTTASATFWQTLASRERAATTVSRTPGAEQQLLATLPLADRAIAALTSAARPVNSLVSEIDAEDPDFLALFKSAPELVSATRRFNAKAPAVLKDLIPILDVLRNPALSLPLLISDGNAFTNALGAYGGDLDVFARQLAAVTSYTYDGKPAIRVTGTLGCVGGTDPYPGPDQAQKDRRAC